MKWYIEISGTSLSEEAKRICKINRIFSLDQLVAIYIADRDFSQLNELTEEIQEEILLFTGNLMSFFDTSIKELSSREDKESSKEISKSELKTKKQAIENISADKLLEKEIINVRLYNICKDNGLNDFASIFREYSRRGTFTHLRNSGNNIDKLLKEIFTKYEILDVDKDPGSNEITDDQYDSLNSFEKYIFQLDPGSYSQCNSAIGPIFEIKENKLFIFLVDFYLNITDQRGVGTNKSAQIKNLINEYFKQHDALDPKQKRFLDFIEEYDKSNFAKDTFELWRCYNESIQSLLFFLLNSYLRFNTRDHIYINRFLCFFEDSQANSYEELEQLFKNELDEHVPSGTIRGQINRTRSKINDFVKEVISIFGKEYLMENINTEKGNEYLFFRNENLEELNIGLPKKLSKEFYRYLFISLYDNHYQDICEGQNIKSYLSDNSLCYISSKYHPDFILSIQKFEELHKKRRNNDLSVYPNEFLESRSLESLSELFIKYLEIEYDDIKINDDKIILLANNEGRKTRKNLLVEIFNESGEPIEYNDLISVFDQKYPGLRTSYRSLRDVLLYASEFTGLGGNTNKYILSEWDEKYVSGPLKELTIAHFKNIQDSDHFYNIYRKIHSQRAEVSLKGLMQVLGSNSFFISDKGGMYYFVDYPPKMPNKHQKSLRSINSAIDKIENKKLLMHRNQTIENLLEKYPDYSKTQVEYAIDLKLGIAEI